MSGGEPLWRRVAGLYLSGIPADAGEGPSRPAAADPAGREDRVTNPTQEVVMLGEALDLVTLAQGYGSPAVPLLLRALIRVIRQLGSASAEAVAEPEHVAPGAPAGEAEKPEAEAPGPAAEPAATGETETTETTAKTAPEQAAAQGEGAVATAALEKRVQETDRKLTALTAAVGQLVDVLQRRTRDGGGVDRRGAPRLPGGNAKVFIHDHPYEVLNWSKGGFQIRIGEADRFSRGGFDFHFVLDLPDEVIEFQGRARPVRIERTALAAEFASLDAAAVQKINDIAERLAAAA